MPTVSGPSLDHKTILHAPAPQIKGYRIIGELGVAGQGRVWRALQLSTNREVALKVPQATALTSQKALLRFEREVELAARLKHPNIAGIYDSGIYHGLYYYAMELLEGVPLDEYVQNNGLNQRQIVELIYTVCQAIQHAHQNGVIHRDIKPSNIIVTKDGQPHILDFGLAMTILKEDGFKTISLEGEITGTPAYMSPEQVAGKHDSLDTRTDVYSIGVVFYKSLTNQFPYDVRSTMLKTLQNIQEHDPLKPSKIAPHIESDVEAIILKTLAKDPSQRYQSVSELAQDMECWLNGLPIMARSNSSIYLLRKVVNRHRYVTAVVACLVIILFGYLSLVFPLYGKLRRTNTELKVATDSMKQQLESTHTMARWEVLDWLLVAWHRNDIHSIRSFASTFVGAEKEDIAAQFIAARMLDQELVPEKIQELRNRLGPIDSCFLEFIVGEYYLKYEDKAKALQAFEKCISCMSDEGQLDQDRWLSIRVRTKLHQLSNGEANVPVLSSVEGNQ